MDESKVKTDEPKVLMTQGEDGKLKAIAGEQNGKLKTVDPKKENTDQFMKIDTNGNMVLGFFPYSSNSFSKPLIRQALMWDNGMSASLLYLTNP